MGTPHRLPASGSFHALSFHVGPESGVTNSKKIKKMQNLRVTSFYMTYKREKKFKPRQKLFTRKSLHKNDLSCSRLHDF
jgi:hypothetical protein